MSRPSALLAGDGYSARAEDAAERLRAALYAAADALVDLVAERTRRCSTSPVSHAEAALLLDIKAAATHLGISVTAVRRFARQGALASVRMGRRVLFRPEALTRFAADHEHQRHGER